MEQFKSMTDKYGNNTNFPDEILSDMTIKGLLGRWTGSILAKVRYALCGYFLAESHNVDAGDKNAVETRFEEVKNIIDFSTPILEDCVDQNICGIEDIFIAVFGIMSDEVYLLRRFLQLYADMDQWDTDFMWNDCKNDPRLKKILLICK